jgi:hypothetical protein
MPGGCGLASRFQNREVASPPRQEVTNRQAGLAATDHHHLVAPEGGVPSLAAALSPG